MKNMHKMLWDQAGSAFTQGMYCMIFTRQQFCVNHWQMQEIGGKSVLAHASDNCVKCIIKDAIWEKPDEFSIILDGSLMFFFFYFSLQISVHTTWIASFLQATVFGRNKSIVACLSRKFKLFSVSLFACVCLWNVVCRQGRNISTSFYWKVVLCVNSCCQSVV